MLGGVQHKILFPNQIMNTLYALMPNEKANFRKMVVQLKPSFLTGERSTIFSPLAEAVDAPLDEEEDEDNYMIGELD